MDALTPHEILLNPSNLRIPTRRAQPSTQMPPDSLELARQHQPSIEDAQEAEMSETTATTPSFSSVGSSRNSISDYFPHDGEDGDVEEIVSPTPPPCRRDLAHEVARSLWGLVCPRNFDMVMPGVYRSSYPKAENYHFLKALGLKTILMLVPEDRSTEYTQFMTDNRITMQRVTIEKNKQPFVTISQCNISSALGLILNKQNHPMLIHCNKGKHRTGCVVGCLRKIQGWTMERIIEEYRHYAAEKARPLDERFLELFNEEALQWMARLSLTSVQTELAEESPIGNTKAMSTRLRG